MHCLIISSTIRSSIRSSIGSRNCAVVLRGTTNVHTHPRAFAFPPISLYWFFSLLKPLSSGRDFTENVAHENAGEISSVWRNNHTETLYSSHWDLYTWCTFKFSHIYTPFSRTFAHAHCVVHCVGHIFLQLVSLDLSSNRFEGTVPLEWKTMSKLKYVDVETRLHAFSLKGFIFKRVH